MKDKSQGKGQDKKKFKQDGPSKTQNVHKTEVKNEENQVCFDHLPPEMLLMILKKLDIPSLLHSRLVNWKWNEMSSELLRSSVWLNFVLTSKNTFKTSRVKRSLEKFLECFENSKNFPYSRYYFKLPHDQLLHVDLKSFIFLCKTNIKSLKLDLKFPRSSSPQDVDKSMSILRALLFNKLPNLTHFGFDLTLAFNPKLNKLKYADPFKYLFTLPHLKVLYVSMTLLQVFPGVVKSLLVTAVNLKRIEPFDHTDITASELRQLKFFHSLGKLDLLQAAEISPSHDFLRWYRTSFKTGKPVIFKLSTLNLTNCDFEKDPSVWPDTTAFINELFDSVKDTVSELEVQDLSFLEDVRLPKFTKLRQLVNCSSERVTFPLEIISSQNIQNFSSTFPVLNELRFSGVNWAEDTFGDDASTTSCCIVTVRILKVSGFRVNEYSMRKLSTMCPNVKEFYFLAPVNQFPCSIPWIWAHMKNIESLHFVIFGMDQNSVIGVNSAFTGISKKNCLLLLSKIQAREKPMPLPKKLEAKLGRKLIFRESKLEELRENASILDLKGLKMLKIQGATESSLSEWDQHSFFDISKMCAFHHMPNTVVLIDIN